MCSKEPLLQLQCLQTIQSWETGEFTGWLVVYWSSLAEVAPAASAASADAFSTEIRCSSCRTFSWKTEKGI